MKAGRDEPLYFSWGDKQTADHPELDRTGPDRIKVLGRRGGGSGLVRSTSSNHLSSCPPPSIPPPHPRPRPPLPLPLPLSFTAAEGGASKPIRGNQPIRLQTVKPRPSCFFRWHPIGCLLRGKKQIKTEIQKIK